MKNIVRLINLNCLIVLLVFSNSCEKIERFARVKMVSVSMGASGVRAIAQILDFGENNCPDHGFCWAENTNPQITDNKISLGKIATKEEFSSILNNLTPNVKNYIRAYMYDGNSLIYSDIVEVTPLSNLISITTGNLSVLSDSIVSATAQLSNIGSVKIMAYGHCWDTISGTTISKSTSNLGLLNKDSVYTSILTGLKPKRTYYVRAYAKINENLIIYGSEKTIVIQEITVTSGTISKTGCTKISAIGYVTSLGIRLIIQYGHCWAMKSKPTIDNFKTQLGPKSITGVFTSNIIGLQPSTTYYVRPYATDGVIVRYGTETAVSIIPPTKPIVSGNGPLCIGDTLILNASYVSGATYQWTGPAGFSSTSRTANRYGITLACEGIYTAKTMINGCLSQGADVNLVVVKVPQNEIDTISDITTTSASVTSNILSNGGGTINSKGICWSTIPNPTLSNFNSNAGSGTSSYILNINGLNSKTTYYVRSYAINCSGISYGIQKSFITK
jgi:hypothetical protein